MACSKVNIDPKYVDDLEDIRNLNFKESEGTKAIKHTILDDVSRFYTKPLKLWKINIGIEEHPKIESIGDYWDEQTMTNIQALLREYEGLFPTRFSKLKGIKGYLGEMKIELKYDSKPVKNRTYSLNPRVKEKVKRNIDRMLVVGLIFLMDEDECMNPIIIQRKKCIEDI
jgi:hypothetical protein